MFTSKLVAALSLVTAALASPMLQKRSCTPDLQNNSTTIFQTIPGDIWHVLEWTATGQFPGATITLNSIPSNGTYLINGLWAELAQGGLGYHIKAFADASRATELAASGNNQLTFQPNDWTSSTHTFQVDCNQCETYSRNVGLACMIRPIGTSTCVSGTGQGAVLTLAPCNTSDPHQQFGFWV